MPRWLHLRLHGATATWPWSALLSAFAELTQQFVAIESRAVSVAEIETDCIVADPLPTRDLDADKILRDFPAVLVPENIALALDLRAGRCRAKRGEGHEAFLVIIPADGDFRADDLDIRW